MTRKHKFAVGTAVRCTSTVTKVYGHLVGLTGVVTKCYDGDEHADYVVAFPTLSKIYATLSTCSFAMMENELEEYVSINENQ